MARLTAALALLLAAPGCATLPDAAAIPAAFVGTWNDDLSQCGNGLSDIEMSVEPSRLNFHETVSTVKRVKARSAQHITVAADAFGEGELRSTTYEMVLSASGEDLTIDGFTRHRCPQK